MENNRHSDEPVHTYGCAFAQRGAQCDCGVIAKAIAWVFQSPAEWLGWASQREDTRGIDYSRYTAAEGIDDDEGES